MTPTWSHFFMYIEGLILKIKLGIHSVYWVASYSMLYLIFFKLTLCVSGGTCPV